MRSLFEEYAMHRNSYYGITCELESCFTDNPEESKKACREFLQEHYKRGEKLALLDKRLLRRYEKEGKHIHSASLYLLGLAMLPLFQEQLDHELTRFVPNYGTWRTKDRDFLYLWYLPAMYHDFASSFEYGTIRPGFSERHRTMQFQLGNHNIQYSPYGTFPYKPDQIPFRFSEALIDNYYFYRAVYGSCEHGILAGYLFFDRFVKNFFAHTKSGLNARGNLRKGSLNWNIGHLTYAAYVADAIICHNIWLGGKREEIEYTQFGLTPLLYTAHPENKLSLKAFPLQFMLCLLDTIEPTKRFDSTLSPLEILQNILIETNKDEGKLYVSWKEVIEKNPDFGKWHQAILDLKNWMRVSVEENDNVICIHF